MKLDVFFAKVAEHEQLEGVGLDSDNECKAGLVVRHRPSGLLTRIPVDAVEKADWVLLRDVLMGEREPQVLQHMTRVVGYFSRVENWNRSKLGERIDRTRGEYGVQ